MIDFKETTWIEISLLYKCNVKCEFCHLGDLKWIFKKQLTIDEVLKMIDEWYEHWHRSVIFTWGEPTLDFNLAYYIQYAKLKWYLFIRVHSNWFRFQNLSYLKDLYNKWLNGITLSIHWYKEIHDWVTKTKDSFNVLLKSLINIEKIKLLDKNFVVDTKTVICRKNYTTLILLMNFLLKFNITRRMFVYTFDTNLYWNFDNLNKIIVPYNTLKPYLNNLLDYCERNNIIDFVLDSVPYCFVDSKYWHFLEDNYFTDKQFHLLDYYSAFESTYDDWKIKYKECLYCSKNNVCTWFSEDNNLLYWKPDFIVLK